MPKGYQIITRNVEGGTVHSVTGSTGNNPIYPAMNEEQAKRVMEEEMGGENPAFHIAPNGKLRITQIVPIEAEYVVGEREI